MSVTISNKVVRGTVASGAGIFVGIMDVFSQFIMFKAKGAIRSNVKAMQPRDPFLIGRLSSNKEMPVQYRELVSIEDIPIERDQWVKGKYYVEAHDSSHFHHDFSIIVNDKVYRMARTPSVNNLKQGFLDIFPGIGERTSWVRQPEHYVDEVPNPKLIEKGYGAGTTEVIATGDCWVKVSTDGHMSVIFDKADGVYSFIELEDKMVMMIRKHSDSDWYGKHRMLSVRSPEQFFDDDNYYMFEKKDGAAVEWHIRKASNGKKYLSVYSWRPDMRIYKKYGVETQINHTYRLHITDTELPNDIPLASGRGEIWCKGDDGLQHVNSILNSSIYNARDSKHRPYLYVHDVMTYKGRDIEHMPYRHKLMIMKELHEQDLRFKIPPYAVTSKGKRSLWEKSRTEPAIDGVVVWNMDARADERIGTPIKVKFKHQQENWYSATIVDTQEQGGDKVMSYPVLEIQDGTRFTSSGKGLTDEVKTDIHNNPDKYIGMEVRYSTEKHFSATGKPWQPTIEEFNTI